MKSDRYRHVRFGVATLDEFLGDYPMKVLGDDRDGWWDLEFPSMLVAARFDNHVGRLGVPREHIRLTFPDRVTDLWSPVTLSVKSWSRLTRAARKVARVVAAAVLLALLAPVPHGTVRHAPATQPATYPVTVLEPLPVTLVTCWDDLACSNGSTLDSWDCARPTFIDDRGQLVHSNGQ